MMTVIRAREIWRCRKPHECDDCGREISVGNPCVELSIYEEEPRHVRSIYTCCRPAWGIRVYRFYSDLGYFEIAKKRINDEPMPNADDQQGA